MQEENSEPETIASNSIASASSGDGDPIPFVFRLLTKQQTADYFGVEVRTIEMWMKKRQLPYRKIAGTVRFLVGDLLKYLDRECLVSAKDKPPRRRQGSRPASPAKFIDGPV